MYRALATSTIKASKQSLASARPSALLVKHTPNTTSVRHSSILKAFVDTIKDQVKKNKDLQQGVKSLQDESGKVYDSEALKKARELYEKAKASQGTGSETFKKASEKLGEHAEKVGSTVNKAWKEAADAEFVKEAAEKYKKASEEFNKAADPLKKNPVVGKVSESFQTILKDESGRYGGFVDKETRRKLREESMKAEGHHKAKPVSENPEAGASMVIHKDSAWKESWNKFKEESSFMQGVFSARKKYEDSDNLFISYTRAFTDRLQDTFGSIFDESDQAQAVKAFQQIDHTFNMEKFMKEAREYIVPELMDAYLKGDTETLKLWCSEATYNVLTAIAQAQTQQGLVSDCRIQDLRDVDLVTAKILDNDVPVLVLSFRTQEVILFRNAISKEIVFGQEDHIEQVTYACVLTKQPEDLQNPITGGWRVIDMAKHDSRPTW
ncbi:protein translocase subunit [Umbelopsis sp. WA50703]